MPAPRGPGILLILPAAFFFFSPSWSSALAGHACKVVQEFSLFFVSRKA